MSGRGAILLALLLALAAGEASEHAWSKARRAVPELRRADLELSAGQGALLGILGGFRPVLADLAWIRAYVKWERRDRGCEALLRLACQLDPHATTFWENRANMVGLDMAHWEIRARGGYLRVTEPEQQAIFARFARKALEGLEEGVPVARRPSSLLVVGGYLAETKLRDPLAAAEYYRRAHLSPPAPWYCAYFVGRLLKDAGQPREAYTYLREVWQRELSLQRDGSPTELGFLRRLEIELGLPFTLRIPRQDWEQGDWWVK